MKANPFVVQVAAMANASTVTTGTDEEWLLPRVLDSACAALWTVSDLLGSSVVCLDIEFTFELGTFVLQNEPWVYCMNGAKVD